MIFSLREDHIPTRQMSARAAVLFSRSKGIPICHSPHHSLIPYPQAASFVCLTHLTSAGLYICNIDTEFRNISIIQKKKTRKVGWYRTVWVLNANVRKLNILASKTSLRVCEVSISIIKLMAEKAARICPFLLQWLSLRGGLLWHPQAFLTICEGRLTEEYWCLGTEVLEEKVQIGEGRWRNQESPKEVTWKTPV